MNQKFALIAITLGLLLAGYLDGMDARMMEAKPISMACVSCAGGVR